MAYRRLPNTDIARIRALKQAIKKSNETDFKNLAVSPATLSEAKKVVGRFEQLTLRYQETFDTQVKANILFQDKVKTAKMYISHFIQVLHMSVIRKEIREDHLEFYGLEDAELLVPDMLSNEQTLEWGERIIKGERKRIAEGGVPIYNPGIARVKVMYDIFKEGYQTQKIHQRSTNRVQEEVSNYRAIIDDVILRLWNEVEEKYATLPQAERISKNKEYGLIYYYRKKKSEKTEKE